MVYPSPAHDAPATFDFGGYGLAIAGAVLFSTKGVIIKLGYAEGLSAEALLAMRMVVAVPIYLAILIVLLWRRPDATTFPRPVALIRIALVGMLGYFVASLLDFSGLVFVSAQLERMVLYTYPFFVLVLGVMFFGDKLSLRTVPPMLLSYFGILILFGWNLATRPEGILAGTFLVLISAIVFALYQHLARQEMRTRGSLLFTCIAMSSAGVVAISYAFAMQGTGWFTGTSMRGWVYGLLLGTVGTVLPSFMLNSALHRIGPRATASMGNVGPIATILMAVLIIGEPFTWVHALGSFCVVAGGFAFANAQRKADASDTIQ